MSQPNRVLVVDDEPNIRLTLSALLRRAGYEVITAESGQEAVGILDRELFDLLLVDLKMPGMDGMQVVAAARTRQADLAIIILTGHGSLDTAIEGLHQGIFDYMLKTSEPSKVLERVQAGLADRGQKQRQRQLIETLGNAVEELRGGQSARPREETPASARVISVGHLALDTWRQVATLGEKTLSLTPTEFRVLLCLAEHAGTMLSYAQLVRYAQGYDADELEAGELIKPHIHHLRQKLEPDPGTPRLILNVRGKGYLLAIDETGR